MKINVTHTLNIIVYLKAHRYQTEDHSAKKFSLGDHSQEKY